MIEEDNIDTDLLLKRQLVWDTLPCAKAPEFLPKVGLLPASESGNQKEHRDSHIRLNSIAPIQNHVLRTALLAGEVVGRAILDNQGIGEVGIEDPQLQQYIKAVTAGVQSTLASLVDGGVIGINVGAQQ